MTVRRKDALVLMGLVVTVAIFVLLLRPATTTTAATGITQASPVVAGSVTINGVRLQDVTTSGAGRTLALRDPARLRPEHVSRADSRNGGTVLVLTDGSELEVGPWERTRLNPAILRRFAYAPAR